MVVVPPVDELDLVGPIQVFNSVNRLAGRPIYSLDVATNADGLTVEGEGGVLTFLARRHSPTSTGPCDSVLLVCGMGSRSVRDPALSGWLARRGRRGAAARRRVRRRVPARRGRPARRPPRHRALEVRARAVGAASAGVRRARAAVGQGRQHLHVGRLLGRHRPGAGLGRGGLRRRTGARGRPRAGAVPAAARRPAAAERLARLAGVGDDLDPRAADLDRRAPADRGCRWTISPNGWR